jgi:ABC-type antimicrobial peptide transport system permease subunit
VVRGDRQAQPGAFTVYLRTSRPAGAAFAQVRQTIAELDPNIPVHGTRTLANQVALSLSRERLVATMTAAFAMLATLLAIVGLYGVMSYTVTRRTREIGIRVALGATSANISWLVVREVLVIAGLGIVAALPAAWWLGRFVSTQLYGVTAGDPMTLLGTMLLLLVVALIAGVIPSARAARLSPTLALRRD